MFTGIVDHCGVITEISHKENAIQLKISHAFSDLSVGESICVDGVCLTITEFRDDYFKCDLSPETLQLTIAKNYRVNSKINLERAMRLSDRLSGHIVTGHVDGVLKIKKFTAQKEFFLCEFHDVEKKHLPLLTVKGSVCVNGVSLTINAVHADYFSVMLIPHTLSKTNLHHLKENDYVNVEYDYLAKLIERRIACV